MKKTIAEVDRLGLIVMTMLTVIIRAFTRLYYCCTCKHSTQKPPRQETKESMWRACQTQVKWNWASDDIHVYLGLATGAVLGGHSLLQIHHTTRTSHLGKDGYLLQIYAGYFLVTLLTLVHCSACRVWQASHIQHLTIFDHDEAHASDWAYIAKSPCCCMIILGVVMELNFHRVGGEAIYPYYPVILLAVTAAFLINPLPIFAVQSRKRLLVSLWRLFFAGFYPVTWYDSYIGDMACSLTYSMGSVAFFTCLYSSRWSDPERCNSSQLYILGFMTALPSVWRALQCLRAWWSMGKRTTALPNLVKYSIAILLHVSLSMYRADQTIANRRLFIITATVHGAYASFWDMRYDWCLGNPAYRYLRATLAYKSVSIYYITIALNPVLRFSWILYIVVPLQLQHSALTSFGVSLVEVFRRGLWSVLRVENEHCRRLHSERSSGVTPDGSWTHTDRDGDVRQIADSVPMTALPVYVHQLKGLETRPTG